LKAKTRVNSLEVVSMEALAPWAEPVLMTAEELLRLPEDEWCYELVEGRLVRMSPTGSRHGRVVMALLLAVGQFVEEKRLGEVFPAETGFWISLVGSPDTVLAPDLAFVRRGREAETGAEGYPRLAPDLVAEVASPSQGHAELGAKAQRWLSAGVRLVWVVFPEARTVEVWREQGLVRTVTAEEELSGEEILPGFVLPVTRLFP
jgi:Uma2 family endonuclease